ncbi:MAG: DinB family protein [Candidatus Rokubacteria bacterium]|nr:DinB family protein [Candidatus Rokubacteria bacterium]
MQYLMLNKMDQDRLLSQLGAMPDFLEASFKTISPLEAAAPGPDDAFSPVEHCWHLADLERGGYAVRIRRLLDEADPWLPDFNGARIARERNYRSLPLAEGVAAFRRARLGNIAILRALDAEARIRRGEQEGVGAIALCDIPAMMAEHDAAHRREIEDWKRARSER